MSAMTPEVVIFVGLQGAGKSSFYRARFAFTHLHLSKDLWPNVRHKQKRQDRELRAALENGQSVVIDNTNATRADREPIIAIARELGARVTTYYFRAELSVCIERNAKREGKDRVPDVALYVTNFKRPRGTKVSTPFTRFVLCRPMASRSRNNADDRSGIPTV